MIPPFVVITPARTFSSLVAGLLDHSGISMDLNLWANRPGYGNPMGFYESMWIIKVNDRILEAMGRSVYDRELPPVEMVERLINTYHHGAIFHIVHVMEMYAALNGYETWGFKDNRVCWLAPLWRLPLMVHEARLITVDRPEDAVVESMMQVWPDQYFWPETAREVYRESRRRADALVDDWPFPTLRLDGDAFFDDTEATIAKLSDFVGRPIDASHLDPNGRHYKGGRHA